MAPWIEGTGLACVVFGEALRKTGQLTAKQCFTHNIARQRRDGHVLVTTGVYAYVRHPGYLGWFIWAVGTQVLLQNPVGVLLFAITVRIHVRIPVPHIGLLMTHTRRARDSFLSGLRTKRLSWETSLEQRSRRTEQGRPPGYRASRDTRVAGDLSPMAIIQLN